ncbi:MAG: bifunctional glutamate N-acetyltransferase/amino-acid acetyltransferase ArgJ [Candidatus Omnitrophota bacterium]|nr:bifunctional glutamate N-acetyltransferase/amino-acid acetyltransferase ArgJ [Candidatus Omnitrophota bacterium]MBU1929422.1 bifunctional glutamate N-acetyltransferase/amino-acid acetyltransferase ArgJ [Candidatus Omnitrophota bacterium]MBU2034893.1 bifunctional glutamate N-acetyltransferase/amino-acid acetyltransferase ArgJ [Candidatus Omnitrophota bacterium]MBU2221617.1 bifunctional glutamate N-acetyltransferase/amino-acid acetyltransferase ArgJ [Candidatus Omnitrophota bacterium]MBU225866
MKIQRIAVLPQGFKANGLSAGIKKSRKPDLALFYSLISAKAGCVVTANKVKAAPLVVNQEHLRKAKNFQAIIVNSGNANCFTGSAGIKDAQDTAGILSRELDLKKESVLVASTGIIGRRLPLDKIKRSIPELVRGLSAGGIVKAKKAILTTDIITKEITLEFNIGDSAVKICGIAKGSGMIAPNMATMLGFIFTDARISQKALDKALRSAVDNSFNCITVDGCMSTNDTVIILANGAARNKLINSGKEFDLFQEALNIVCLELAKLIIRDGEGATKFITIKVSGARSLKEAKQAGLAIANSNLFKTAIFGENPNFGRVAASIGSAGVSFNENKLKVFLSPLNKKIVRVKVDLFAGRFSSTIYTCDLSPEYIKINAAYN